MRNVASFVIVCILLIFIMVACVATIGAAFHRAGDVADSTSAAAQARAEAARAREAEAEAERAEAEREQMEEERRKLEEERRKLEEEVARVRAEGERAEANADAYVTRRLGDEAARAIRRQGRLLSWYVLRESGRAAVMWVVLGAAITVGGLLAWAVIREERGKK